MTHWNVHVSEEREVPNNPYTGRRLVCVLSCTGGKERVIRRVIQIARRA